MRGDEREVSRVRGAEVGEGTGTSSNTESRRHGVVLAGLRAHRRERWEAETIGMASCGCGQTVPRFADRRSAHGQPDCPNYPCRLCIPASPGLMLLASERP